MNAGFYRPPGIAERHALAVEREAMRTQFDKEREAMTAQLEELRGQIAQAERLREQLTALR